ncbi:MAG: thioredoxin-dependent thiol peroxidase [Hyphomicrobiales bacterium]
MTAALSIGDDAPNFSLPTDSGGEVSLDGLRDRSAVVYFYPKDDTSGCTKQAIAFTELNSEFDKLNASIIGISADTPAKHDKFKAKHGLTVTLASDEGHDVLEAYGVWVEKNMYGRKYMGIERATFLVDKTGKIAQIWRKVKVPGHAEQVLKAVADLS